MSVAFPGRQTLLTAKATEGVTCGLMVKGIPEVVPVPVVELRQVPDKLVTSTVTTSPILKASGVLELVVTGSEAVLVVANCAPFSFHE